MWKRWIVCFACMLVCMQCRSATKADPADYTIGVHVKESEFVFLGGPNPSQVFDVMIAARHYKLGATAMDADVHGIGLVRQGLLPIGDYKARIVPHKAYTPAYLNYDLYELLLPDGRTLQARVIAVYE